MVYLFLKVVRSEFDSFCIIGTNTKRPGAKQVLYGQRVLFLLPADTIGTIIVKNVQDKFDSRRHFIF